MKHDPNIERLRLQQSQKAISYLQQRLDAAEVRQRRLEAQLDLIERRLEHEGQGLGGTD